MTLAYNKEAKLFVDFLKVLRFSFPLPVVGLSASLSPSLPLPPKTRRICNLRFAIEKNFAVDLQYSFSPPVKAPTREIFSSFDTQGHIKMNCMSYKFIHLNFVSDAIIDVTIFRKDKVVKESFLFPSS